MLTPLPTHSPESTDSLYSLIGRQLKLDTLDQTQPYLDQIAQVPTLREVRFGGNTLGIDACQGIARTLEDKHHLEARAPSLPAPSVLSN